MCTELRPSEPRNPEGAAHPSHNNGIAPALRRDTVFGSYPLIDSPPSRQRDPRRGSESVCRGNSRCSSLSRDIRANTVRLRLEYFCIGDFQLNFFLRDPFLNQVCIREKKVLYERLNGKYLFVKKSKTNGYRTHRWEMILLFL